MNYPHIMSRVLDTPLLITPEYMQVWFGALADRVGIDTLILPDGERLDRATLEEIAFSFGESTGSEAGLYPVRDGVAILNVSGSLAHKTGNIQPRSGMTGYDGLELRFIEAMDDPEVTAVLLDIDSPGGEVSGCFDLCDTIRGARGIKPIVAYAGEMAASAAYAIGSAADALYLPRTGAVGSVGVLTAHKNVSKALEEKGVEVTLIYAGAHKVDGNPYEALSDDVREKIQARLDKTYDLFAETVALNRGMSVAAVKATEAQVYSGQEAVDIGFADGVATFNEVLQGMRDKELMTLGGDGFGDFASAEMPTTTTYEIQLAPAEVSGLEEEAVEDLLQPADPGTVITLCAEKGLDSDVILSLVEAGLTDDEVVDRIEDYVKIQDVCAAAGIQDAAAILAAYDDPTEMVRLTAIAAKEDSESIDGSHDGSGDMEVQETPVNVTGIWEKRRADHGRTA